jgi:hypothetical protein
MSAKSSGAGRGVAFSGIVDARVRAAGFFTALFDAVWFLTRISSSGIVGNVKAYFALSCKN